jgi:type IV secretory pathway TrbD component
MASGSDPVLVGLLIFAVLIIVMCLWCAVGCNLQEWLANHINHNQDFW